VRQRCELLLVHKPAELHLWLNFIPFTTDNILDERGGHKEKGAEEEEEEEVEEDHGEVGGLLHLRQAMLKMLGDAIAQPNKKKTAKYSRKQKKQGKESQRFQEARRHLNSSSASSPLVTLQAR